MFGVSVSLDFSELDRFAELLGDIGDFDRNALLVDLGAVTESQIRNRLSNEKTTPDGVAWPEWSDTYKATRHGNHSLLEGSGDLIDSIQPTDPSGDMIFVGSNLEYAARQNFGDDDDGGIPAREYLGFSDDNIDELLDVAEDFMKNHLKGL
jgi:phage virion morphogenesis protein